MISAEDAERFAAESEAWLLANCDGKMCGTGKHAGGSTYVCRHNNLKTKRPDLMSQWDYKKNVVLPETLSVKTHTRSWWICPINPCGCHKWDCKVQERTNNNSNTGCPFCCGRRICVHNSLYATNSSILLEWDYERNGNIKPWQVSQHSSKEYWWKCWTQCLSRHCDCHHWQAQPDSRMRPGNGCPFCSGRRVCLHTSLYTVRPNIAAEWDYERNGDLKPWQITPWSGKQIWWKCPFATCECHKWQVSPAGRVSDDTWCPYCSHNKTCIHDSLYAKFSEIASEWDYQRNGDITPWNIAPKSDIKCQWICRKDGNHLWPATPHNRVSSDSDCPHCSKSCGYSKAQIKWLKDIEIKSNINIRHALCAEGEYRIQGLGKNGGACKVDGYCQETNTVYEYHGDYWHGNPNMYDMKDVNRSVNKTFEELYQRTLDRDNKIRSLGYNLIVKWETEFVELDYIVEIAEPGFVMEFTDTNEELELQSLTISEPNSI